MTIPPVSTVSDTNLVGPLFNSTIAATRKALIQQQKVSKKAPTTKNARFMVKPWGWVDYQVDRTKSARVAIGVVDPSIPVSIAGCARGQDSDRTVIVVLYGFLGIVACLAFGLFGAGGRPAKSGLAWTIAIAGVLLSVCFVVGSLRRYRRIRAHGRRISTNDPSYELIFTGIARYAQITQAGVDFLARMRTATKAAKLEPVPLPESMRPALDAIQASLWSIATGREAASDAAVTDGMQAVTTAFMDSIATSWASLESFSVPIPREQEEALPKIDTARDLQSLAGQIEADRSVKQRVNEDIARINRPTSGD